VPRISTIFVYGARRLYTARCGQRPEAVS